MLQPRVLASANLLKQTVAAAPLPLTGGSSGGGGTAAACGTKVEVFLLRVLPHSVANLALKMGTLPTAK